MTSTSTAGVDPHWLIAFADRPAAQRSAAADFWALVTGTVRSPARGERGEFETLVPADGDPFLKVQEVLDGGGGHLDVCVGDLDAAIAAAVALGARPDPGADPGRRFVALTSPAGLRWCLMPEPAPVGPALLRPAPQRRSDGSASLVDQVCLDIPPAAFEAECTFWQQLTGWSLHTGSRPEFAVLARPSGVPLRLMLQRLDADPPTGRANCHLDLACTDVAGETARHEGWGARVLARFENWTTLADPGGSPYCLTRRDPATGMLPPS